MGGSTELITQQQNRHHQQNASKSCHCRSQWSSGSMPDCSARSPGIESYCGHWAVVFIVKATVIYSLGHRLCAPFLQCLGQLRSTQPSILHGTVNEYQLSG